MKRIFGLTMAALFLILGTTVYAHCGKCGIGDEQANEDPAKDMSVSSMVDEKANMLTEKLKLTDEQKTKVQAILKEKMEKKAAIMDEKHKAMTALHEEFQSKLSSILTPEQMKNWEEMKNEGMKEGKCPMCKDGKMCKMCALKKSKGEAEHEHEHQDKN